MVNTTNNTDNKEAYKAGILPEQMRRRTSVITTAGYFLGLREFTMAEATPVVNEGPVADSRYASNKEIRENTHPYVPAGHDPSLATEIIPQDQTEYLAAIAPDTPAADDLTAMREAARAILPSIYDGSNN